MAAGNCSHHHHLHHRFQWHLCFPPHSGVTPMGDSSPQILQHRSIPQAAVLHKCDNPQRITACFRDYPAPAWAHPGDGHSSHSLWLELTESSLSSSAHRHTSDALAICQPRHIPRAVIKMCPGTAQHLDQQLQKGATNEALTHSQASEPMARSLLIKS